MGIGAFSKIWPQTYSFIYVCWYFCWLSIDYQSTLCDSFKSTDHSCCLLTRSGQWLYSFLPFLLNRVSPSCHHRLLLREWLSTHTHTHTIYFPPTPTWFTCTCLRRWMPQKIFFFSPFFLAPTQDFRLLFCKGLNR